MLSASKNGESQTRIPAKTVIEITIKISKIVFFDNLTQNFLILFSLLNIFRVLSTILSSFVNSMLLLFKVF